MKNKIMATALAVIVLLVGGWTYQSAKPKYEYMIYSIPLNEADLNKFGGEGWELIAVTETNTVLGKRPVHYFKRAKP